MENKGCKLSVSSYGTTMEWHSDYDDATLEDFLDAFYGCLIGLTFQPRSIIEAMERYAQEHLKEMEPMDLNTIISKKH